MIYIDDKGLKNSNGQTLEEFLLNYDANKYQKPSVAVDMIIFTVKDEEKQNYRRLPGKDLNILMIKRRDHPFIGQWALPGGFVSADESLDEAALRELKEETNIDNIYMEQLYTWGSVDRDPRTRIIGCSYLALVDSCSLNVISGDDAEDARWFTVKNTLLFERKTNTLNGYIHEQQVRVDLLSENDNIYAVIKMFKTVEEKVTKKTWDVIECSGIAFDHAKIINYSIQRLRRKIEYTDMAFNLMPEFFSLTQLQQVYEIILGRKLLKANFRRKISNMVIETNENKKDAGHRPSKLYKFNTDWMEKTF